MRHQPTPSRTGRVATEILREINELLRREIRHPLLTKPGMVTLTDAEVTRDYAHAKIFYSTLAADAEQKTAIARALQQTVGFMRSQVAQRLTLHHCPLLHFVYDDSVERGNRLDGLIAQANQQAAKE